MTVLKCDIPTASVLDRALIDAAYFQDSYRAPLRRTDASVVDIFYAISNNRWGYRDTEHARQVIGFEPQDTAEEHRK